MISSASPVLVCVWVLSFATLFCTAQFLDQSTDFEPNALRLLTNQYLWQSFNASWTSNLVYVDVYVGSEQDQDNRDACQSAKVTFDITKGPVSSRQDITSNSIAHVELQYNCDETAPTRECVAVRGYPHPYFCGGWVRIEMGTPIPVIQDQTYSFVVQVNVNDFAYAPIAGVTPKSENHGGASSLITGKFETFYTQFAFRTYMSTEQSQVTIAPLTESTEAASTDNPVQQEGVNDSNKKVGAAGFVIPVVVGLLLILLIAFVVVQRRKWSKEKILDSSQLYRIGSHSNMNDGGLATHSSDEADGIMQHKNIPSRSMARHPIYVRSQFEDEEDEEEEGTWADEVNYSSYGTRTTRRLPSTPHSSEV
eukprot:m.11411 g.11411  ORF g.11411 m.11411 type:complete len:365 (+) comp3833_c1_seq1:84-1178(+)